jgi:hypothetical protein
LLAQDTTETDRFGGGFAMPAERAEDGVSPAEQGRAERRPAGSFRSLFPALGDVRPEYVYGGAIGVTRDLLPRIGLLSPRISYAYGYCGHGTVLLYRALELAVAVAVAVAAVESSLAADMPGGPFPPTWRILVVPFPE